jgi:type VI secretion system protein ImpG
METLLPHYERQLVALHRLCREFAAKHPKLAGALMLVGDACGDPHIERLIQATALLNARTAKLLDDDYGRFTEALLSVLYPHYLRALPSFSIAWLDASVARAHDITAVTTIPRGTLLKANASAAPCKFTTAYDVTLGPVAIAKAGFATGVQAPPTLRMPDGASAHITIEIASTSSTAGLDQIGLDTVRAYLDGEPSCRALLRDVIFMRTVAAYVEGADQRWVRLDALPLAAVGFDAIDAMLPFNASEHPAYRLLVEYFAYPEKFNFVDIDLAALVRQLPAAARSLTLHLVLSDVRGDSNTARILKPLSAANFLLGCTPIINLFKAPATPIRLTHMKSAYPLLLDVKPPAAFEVYSVDSVRLLRLAAEGCKATEFVPYYSLRHGAAGTRRQNHYYLVHRDEELAAISPGHEFSVTIVDGDFQPLAAQTGTVSLNLTLSNRDLPASLPYGMAGGDLEIDSHAAKFPVRLLRKPSASQRLLAGRGAHWELISHLSLNHRSLTTDGLDALAAMLKLHAVADSAVSQRQIDGIVALEQRSSTAWLRDRDGAAYLSGVEVRVTLDEDAFAGTGIHAFVQLLDHFFGLSVHLNSFTRLIVLSKASGKELHRCLPRNGSLSLV